MAEMMSEDQKRRILEIVAGWETSNPEHVPFIRTKCYGARRITESLPISVFHIERCSSDVNGKKFVDCFLQSPEFLSCETIREQIFMGVNMLIGIHNLSKVAAMKELSLLIGNRSVDCESKLYILHSKHIALSVECRDNLNKTSGRPSSLKETRNDRNCILHSQKICFATGCDIRDDE